ncbi:kinase-like domain-containing protein [Sparassis latifolia]
MAASSIPNFTGYLLDGGRFKLVKLLGAGAYGVVYRAVDLHAPSSSSATAPVERAIKILRKAGPAKSDTTQQRREISLHRLVSEHPNVVTVHDAFEDSKYFYLVMDYYPGGDLFRHICEKKVLVKNDEMVRKVFLQILDAVQACHRNKVFHRDLKPENIMCNVDGSQVYVGDFGLATSRPLSYTHGCGSSFYMSPECIGEELGFAAYSTKQSDIWSLGVILINMITGRNPWESARCTDSCFSEFILDPDYFYHCMPISRGVADILNGIFVLDPSSRTSIRRLRKAILAVDTFFMSATEEAQLAEAARASSDVLDANTSAHVIQSEVLFRGKDDDGMEIEEVDIGTMHPDFGEPHPAHDSLPPRPQTPFGRPMNDTTDSSHPSSAPTFEFDEDESVDLSSTSTSMSGYETSGPITPDVVKCEPTIDIPDFRGLGEPLCPLATGKERSASPTTRLLQRLELIAVSIV